MVTPPFQRQTSPATASTDGVPSPAKLLSPSNHPFPAAGNHPQPHAYSSSPRDKIPSIERSTLTVSTQFQSDVRFSERCSLRLIDLMTVSFTKYLSVTRLGIVDLYIPAGTPPVREL
ncbi:hypothetical protein L1887_33257 [Cichorium endivia]|nr:hypothetical protein L1887_33257 [Cichorium endivia]